MSINHVLNFGTKYSYVPKNGLRVSIDFNITTKTESNKLPLNNEMIIECSSTMNCVELQTRIGTLIE